MDLIFLAVKGKNKGKFLEKPYKRRKKRLHKRPLHNYLWRMKFEMKKRILALALAGTTAFSVFGAAISANAAQTFLSTDNVLKVDAYETYVPVSGDINITAQTPNEAKTEYSTDNGNSWLTYDELKEQLSYSGNLKTSYSAITPIGQKPAGNEAYAYLTNDGKTLVFDDDGNYTKHDLTDVITSVATEALGISYNTGTKEYTVSDVYKGNDSDKGLATFSNLSEAFAAVKTRDAKKIEDLSTLYVVVKKTNSTVVVDDLADVKYKDVDDYIKRSGEVVKKYTNATLTGTPSVTVDVKKTSSDVPASATDSWEDWDFNSDMTGDVAVEPYEVTTTLSTNVYGTPVLNVTKTVDPTIYAYDYLYINPEVTASAGDIANVWNATAKDTAKLANLIGNDVEVELGRGRSGRGIRYDVILDWEAFLEELAISEGSYYYTVDNYNEFESMYLDRFYNDPVFNGYTGVIDHYDQVDLYNIRGLLSDIWALRTDDKYEQANTSEMIYLMQQYDKYIGEYIDQAEVTTDEWGDLLVELLNAASADDFKYAIDYKKYTAKVAELTANYENALTEAQVLDAERNMYALLTNKNAQYNAAKTADKAALSATMEGLYFNVGDAPIGYSTMPSTLSDNVDYSNYNYYVAAVTGGTSISKNDDLKFTSTLSRGYYSLYPMADYMDYDSTTPNQVYAGNTANPDKVKDYTFQGAYATEEYEWFWNVYQLAANMNANNKYQGSVDAINDALNAAVADLAVTTTPAAVDTGAMNDAVDKYAGKIDTDYVEGYYNKYVQANDYAANVAEGKWQTRIAAMINGVAGEALTYQGTQVTVTKNDMKTVETAIKNGKTALEAIKADANYNAAQVNALNKAIDQAEYLVSLYEGTYSNSGTLQSVNKQYTYLVGDKDQMVKSDLTKAIEAIDSAINYSEIVMGWSKNDAGKWQYGTEEGYLSNGWNKIGKTWFYFNADGTAKQSEWFQENGTWYWFNSNCGAATGWAKVDGEWYFFKGNNAMKTGWEKVDGNWYYMASSGKMVTGWCEVNGKWYYFSKESNSLGQMLYSTTVDGYKLGADGAWIK